MIIRNFQAMLCLCLFLFFVFYLLAIIFSSQERSDASSKAGTPVKKKSKESSTPVKKKSKQSSSSAIPSVSSVQSLSMLPQASTLPVHPRLQLLALRSTVWRFCHLIKMFNSPPLRSHLLPSHGLTLLEVAWLEASLVKLVL